MVLEPGKDYVVRLGSVARVLTLDVNPHWQAKWPFILRSDEDLYYCDEEGTVDPKLPLKWRVLGVHHKAPLNVGEHIGFYQDGVLAYGVVRHVDGDVYAVEIDEDWAVANNNDLHNCAGHVPSYRGWWVCKGAAIFDWSPAKQQTLGDILRDLVDKPQAEPSSPVPSPEVPSIYGFKVGDVVTVSPAWRGEYTATVLGACLKESGWIAVRPHTKPEGLLLHGCDGLAPDNDGRWEYHKDLVLSPENTSSPKEVRTLNSEERAQIWAAFTHSNRSIEECVAAWDWLMSNS